MKFFQGFKNGTLKSTKGNFISEDITAIQNVTVSSFKISFNLEGENKIIESYLFAYNNVVYTIQFMNNEKEYEDLTNFRQNIIDSIQLK